MSLPGSRFVRKAAVRNFSALDADKYGTASLSNALPDDASLFHAPAAVRGEPVPAARSYPVKAAGPKAARPLLRTRTSSRGAFFSYGGDTRTWQRDGRHLPFWRSAPAFKNVESEATLLCLPAGTTRTNREKGRYILFLMRKGVRHVGLESMARL